jgi:hypothetical protein
MLAAPTHAAPPLPRKVACAAVDAAQQHDDAAGGEVNQMRTALQASVVGRNKMEWTNNVSVAVNADIRDLQADEAALGAPAFTHTVNTFADAVQDMNQSVKGIYRLIKDDDDLVPNLHSDIPSPDTYAFVDTAGDKQAAVAAVINGLRAGGCA